MESFLERAGLYWVVDNKPKQQPGMSHNVYDLYHVLCLRRLLPIRSCCETGVTSSAVQEPYNIITNRVIDQFSRRQPAQTNQRQSHCQDGTSASSSPINVHALQIGPPTPPPRCQLSRWHTTRAVSSQLRSSTQPQQSLPNSTSMR